MMLELIRRQISRVMGHLGKVEGALNERFGNYHELRNHDDRELWGSIMVALNDCEYELQWLSDRLTRAEAEQQSEVNRIVDRELERRGREEQFRRERLEKATAIRRDPQRVFSALQRQEIYRRADGHCQGCGQPLGSAWHADHIVPHSRGGRTEVINGQALCQPCNSRKSAKVLTVDE